MNGSLNGIWSKRRRENSLILPARMKKNGIKWNLQDLKMNFRRIKKNLIKILRIFEGMKALKACQLGVLP